MLKNYLNTIIIVMISLLALAACTPAENKAPVPPTITDNQQTLRRFLVEDILENRVLAKMYPPEYVLNELGTYSPAESIRVDNMSYEGAKITNLEKYRFQKFNALVYVLENGHKIFGYIELLPGYAYNKFMIGTYLKDSINQKEKGLHGSENEYYFFSSFQDNWDLQIRIKTNSNDTIENVKLYIGGI